MKPRFYVETRLPGLYNNGPYVVFDRKRLGYYLQSFRTRKQADAFCKARNNKEDARRLEDVILNL